MELELLSSLALDVVAESPVGVVPAFVSHLLIEAIVFDVAGGVSAQIVILIAPEISSGIV